MSGSRAASRPGGRAARGRGRTPGQSPSSFFVQGNTNPSFQNPYFQTPSSFNPSRFISQEMVEAAVSKAQRDLLSVGENVSVWKVSQSAALALQVSSWDSIGFRFHDIPYLRDLQFVEGKVNAFIHSFVSVRRMTSVYELGLEICKSEGVAEFGELGLGPLLRHNLVRQYFLIPPDLKEVCSITIDDLISSLSVFLYRVKSKEFTVEEFLDYLMKKYSVPARENLGVRIQSMGLYIKFIKGARRAESAALRSIQERDLLKEQRETQAHLVFNDHLDETSKEASSSNVCNNKVFSAIRCCECCPALKRKNKKHAGCKCNGSVFVDELKLIGLKLAMFNHGNSRNLSTGNEEKPESYDSAAYEIVKIDPTKANQLVLSSKQIDSFVATWKGACQKHSVDEVLALMLNVYKCSDKQKRKMQRLFFLYPAVGLLNMAVLIVNAMMTLHNFIRRHPSRNNINFYKADENHKHVHGVIGRTFGV